MTTSCVLHLAAARSPGWLQLFVTFLLQSAKKQKAGFKIQVLKTVCMFGLKRVNNRTCRSHLQTLVLRACDGVRGATAAPSPAAGAPPTGRAWPEAGGLLTFVVEDLLAVPVDMEHL